MLRNKVVTLGAIVGIGVASLGAPQFIAHADTTKSGNTVVSYTGTAPQPKDWGISVPATVNLTQTVSAASLGNTELKAGEGTVSLVDTNGEAFKDTSGNRSFLVSATSSVTFQGSTDDQFWGIKDKDGQTLALYVKNSLLSSNDFNIYSNNNNPLKLNFKSMANGQNSVLSSNLTFGVPIKNNGYTQSQYPMDLTKSYSDTITWTASETAN